MVLPGDLPTAEKVQEPDPDHGRREENLARRGHEKQPGRAAEGKELDGRSRGRNVEREESEEEEEDVLQVGLFEVVLLQVAQAIPDAKRGVETGELVDARVSGVGLCAGATTAVVALGEAVEEGQVDVLGQESRQLGLARQGAGTIGHG